MNATQEKMIRKSMERIDRQMVPQGAWNGDYITCPHCNQRQRQLWDIPRGQVVTCPCCDGQFRKG